MTKAFRNPPLIWLMKRHYMGKDLINDRYGRYFEIPRALSRWGEVAAFCLDYGGGPQRRVQINDRFVIHSYPARNLFGFLAAARRAARSAPDAFVVGASDAPYCALAAWAAQNRQYAVDLYDDYETFAFARAPLVSALFHRAVRKAHAVVAFENAYAERLKTRLGVETIAIAPNGVDASLFRPLDRTAARAKLGLPPNALIFGYFGAISDKRTMDDLFGALAQIRQTRPDAMLLLAGARSRGFTLPADGIDYRGLVDQQALPQMIAACDVGTATVRKDDSAEICFPTKIMEYIACGRPFVTPTVGGATRQLQNYPHFLYPQGASEILARRILRLSEQTAVRLPPVYDWRDAAADFARAVGWRAQPQDADNGAGVATRPAA